MKHSPTRIMLIEDHPGYRRVLQRAFDQSNSLQLEYVTGMAERALRKLRDMEMPDVILLDLSLLGMSGLDALPEFRELAPDTKIIILSQSDEEADVLEAISRGADGYLLKSSSIDEIESGIASIRGGGAPLDANVAQHLLKALRTGESLPTSSLLTEREERIINLIAEGLVKKEIAATLEISTFTVNAHVRNIYEKLGVPNAPAAISKAFHSGILSPDKRKGAR